MVSPMQGYSTLVMTYNECVVSALKTGLGQGRGELKKRLQECLSRFIDDFISLVNRSTSSFAHIICSDYLRFTNSAHNLTSLLSVVGRLVYRGRPGGGENVPPLEYGIRLHPVFLVPYIPGSSIKGVMSTAYLDLLRNRGVSGIGAEGCAEALFGASEGASKGVGGIVVFDAYPLEPGAGGMFIIGDVLTPHYSVTAKLSSELDVKPNPVRGVSIAEGTLFLFMVGIDEDYVLERFGDKRSMCLAGARNVAVLVLSLLLSALERVGVGGKATRGYGFFRVEGLKLLRPRPGGSRSRLSRFRS
jgi:CRISPR type III-B/RAMP module RAMP protein Cmr6